MRYHIGASKSQWATTSARAVAIAAAACVASAGAAVRAGTLSSDHAASQAELVLRAEVSRNDTVAGSAQRLWRTCLRKSVDEEALQSKSEKV